MTNLWDEATRDHDAERDSMLRSAAKITTARWWPFLAEASTERSFGHRLAVVKGDVLAALKEAGVTSARFQEEALEGLAEDFRVLHASRREAFWGGKDKGKPDPGPGFDPTTWTLARLELAMADLPIATWWDDAKKSAIKAAYDAKRGLTPATAAAEFVVCPDCNGTGAVPAGGWEDEDDVDNGLKQCPTCKGEGEVPARTAVRRTANRPGSTQRGARALRGSTVTWADGSRTGTIVELAPLDSPPHPVKGRWGDIVTERTRAVSKDHPAKEIEACWVSSEGQMVWASVHVPTMKVIYSVETAQQVFSSRKRASDSGWTGMDAIDEGGLFAGQCAQGSPNCNWGWAKDGKGREVYRCSVHGTEQAVSHTRESARKTASVLRWEDGGSGPGPNGGYSAMEMAMVGPRTLAQYGETYDGGGYYTLTGKDVGYFGGFASPAEAKAAVESIYGAGEGLLASRKTAASSAFVEGYRDAQAASRTGTHRGNPYRDSTPAWEEYRAGKAAFRAGAPEPSEDPVEEALIWSDDMDPSLIMAGSKGWPEMPVQAAARPRDPDLEDDLREREDMARERSRTRTDAEEDALDNELDDIDQRRRRASRRTAALTKCGSCGGIATAGDRVECLDCGEVSHTAVQHQPVLHQGQSLGGETATRIFDRMTQDDRFLGWGYLGDRGRFLRDPDPGSAITLDLIVEADEAILEVVRDMGWTYDDLFAWANSKDGRWFADMAFGAGDLQGAMRYLRKQHTATRKEARFEDIVVGDRVTLKARGVPDLADMKMRNGNPAKATDWIVEALVRLDDYMADSGPSHGEDAYEMVENWLRDRGHDFPFLDRPTYVNDTMLAKVVSDGGNEMVFPVSALVRASEPPMDGQKALPGMSRVR